MTHAGYTQQERPDDPTSPTEQSQRDERKNREARNGFVQARRNSKHDVPDIQLTASQKVQCSSKHSHPGCNGDWMQLNPIRGDVSKCARMAEGNQQLADNRED